MQADETPDETVAGPVAALSPLHPNQIKVLRFRVIIAALVAVGVTMVLDIGPLQDTPLPRGLVPGAAALLGLIGIALLPGRRYRAWGYREGTDELFVKHGLFKRVLTVVPFGRVQHIDISQGPVERRYGLGTLSLHTAGTRSAEVSLPGLAQDDAEAMRDRIRAQIRQDLV